MGAGASPRPSAGAARPRSPVRVCASSSTTASAGVVRFSIRGELDYGDEMCVVGSAVELGAWNPDAALPLRWTEGNVWRGELAVPAGGAMEYKLIVRRGGGYRWEAGDNREVQLDAGAALAVTGTLEGDVKVETIEGGEGEGGGGGGGGGSERNGHEEAERAVESNGVSNGASSMSGGSGIGREWQGKAVTFNQSRDSEREQREAAEAKANASTAIDHLHGVLKTVVEGNRDRGSWQQKLEVGRCRLNLSNPR